MANNELTAMLTNIDDLLLETNNCISRFNNALAGISESAVGYIHQYDQYVYETKHDSKYLKSRMKDTIMKAVSDELH